MLDCVSGYNDSSGHAYPGQCRSPLIRSSSDNSTWDIYCVLMIGWTHPGAAHPRWAHAGDDGGFDWLLLLFLVMIAQSARAEISGTFCLATWECWYKAIRVRQVCNFRRSPDWPSCRLLHWPCDTGSFPISTSFGQWSIGNESSLSDIVSVHWQLSWSYDRHPVPILCNWGRRSSAAWGGPQPLIPSHGVVASLLHWWTLFWHTLAWYCNSSWWLAKGHVSGSWEMCSVRCTCNIKWRLPILFCIGLT